MIPYGRQSIDETDIHQVIEALRSDWLTTGPKVAQFESEFARYVDSAHAVSVCNGTAALHAAMLASGVDGSHEVIVPAITFVATANAVLYQNATPVFADVDPETLLIDPADVLRKITPRTRAIVAVDYAGQPCDYHALREIADRHNLILIADACHSLGGSWQNQPVGSLADLNCFSFHPVKPLTTGEGGMVTTSCTTMAAQLKRFRGHGIDADFRKRTQQVTHRYDMVELGYNFRLTDFQAALGLSQLAKLNQFCARRTEIADQYHSLLAEVDGVLPLQRLPGSQHAYHLFVVRISDPHLTRDEAFERLRNQGVGVNVHYRPVYLNSYYQKQLGYRAGLCPVAESAYEQILSLPIFPEMTSSQILTVVDALKNCFLRSQPLSKAG